MKTFDWSVETLDFYFFNRMLPHLQIDEQDPSIYITDANKLINLKLDEKTFKYVESSKDNSKTSYPLYPLNNDILNFIKKDNYIFSFSK